MCIKRENNVKFNRRSHCLFIVKSIAFFCTVIAACLTGLTAYAHESIASKVELYRVQLAVDENNIKLRKKYMRSLNEVQQYDQALSQLALLKKQSPDDDDLDFDGAFIAFSKGDFALANRHVENFLKNNPDDDGAQLISGRAKFQLQDYTGAINALNQSLAKKPFTDTYIYKADVYIAQGKLKEAISTYQEGVQTLGLLPLFLEKIIELKEQLKDYQGALTSLTQLINKVGPNVRTEHYLLHKGQLLERLGNMEKAQVAYQQSYQQLNSRSDLLKDTPHSKELARVLNIKLKPALR